MLSLPFMAGPEAPKLSPARYEDVQAEAELEVLHEAEPAGSQVQEQEEEG